MVKDVMNSISFSDIFQNVKKAILKDNVKLNISVKTVENKNNNPFETLP